jgi:hypothetical protein
MSLRLALLSLALPLVACGGKDPSTDPIDTSDTAGDTDTADTTDTPEVDCGDGPIILSGEITEDTTLYAACPYVLRGGVIVGDDTNETVLTIQAGTTIYGEAASDGFLVIRRGSKIEANGTADAPIVFTSDQLPGQRARGDWGGVVLNGRAPINACAPGTPLCEAEGEGGTGQYGGNDAADSSGTLRYVRVEYAGTEISPDNELNGVTFAGVGSGTTVDYLQVHANLDDGIEFFGGAANAKHVVLSCNGDDNVDWDLGYIGQLQFGLITQCDDAGNNGIEADNNEADFAAAPRSNGLVSNFTFVGSPSIAEDNFGVLFRRGTSAEVWNTIITGFTAGCIDTRDNDDTTAAFQHVLLDCTTAFEDAEEQALFDAGMGNNDSADIGFAIGYSDSDPDYRPSAGSDAASGGMAPSGSFWDAASYIGAFAPGAADWTDGWTNFARN